MDYLMALEPWHWMALGIALLALEVVLGTELLLGIGLGALVTALLYKIMPGLNWQTQIISFAILSIGCTMVYWKRFRSSSAVSDKPLLNQRAQQLIGKTTRLVTPIVAGEGKIQVADALWTVIGSDLPEGTSVKVVGVDGMNLFVEALE